MWLVMVAVSLLEKVLVLSCRVEKATAPCLCWWKGTAYREWGGVPPLNTTPASDSVGAVCVGRERTTPVVARDSHRRLCSTGWDRAARWGLELDSRGFPLLVILVTLVRIEAKGEHLPC